MTEPPTGFQLTNDDVAVVLQAIRAGRVRDLDDVPYDPEQWDEEAVRYWLERTHRPAHARYIVTTLGAERHIKSRPMSPTTSIALQALIRRIAQLEREVADLHARLSHEA
jgi:hypothetical protein